MGAFEHFNIGRRNFNCENNWEELSYDKYRISKPTLICFGGNGTVNSRTANAMCKMAQGLIGLKHPTTNNEIATANDIDFVGISYGVNSIAGDGALTDEEKLEFFENMFLPLCTNKSGVILSKEQMLRNFNLITFFSHCHGTKEIAELLDISCQQMQKLGIDEKTTTEVLSQIFTVSYAPEKKCNYPNLQIVPMNDFYLELGPKDSSISEQFIKQRYSFGNHDRGTIAYKEDDKTVSVLVSNMIQYRLDDHAVHIASRNEDWQLIEDNPIYGDEISQLMGYTLAKSIANSIQNQNSETFIPKPNADEVLQDATDILIETKNSDFENIIEQIKTEQSQTNELPLTQVIESSVSNITFPIQDNEQ